MAESKMDWFMGRTEAQKAKRAEAVGELKEKMAERRAVHGDQKVNRAAKVGRIFLALVTLPLIGLAVAGIVGAGIGLAIGILIAIR